MREILLLFLVCTCALAPMARADVTDPFDPNDHPFLAPDEPEQTDDDKNADELMLDAHRLFADDRPLDARTKLLKALKKEPENYRVHFLLAGYYIEHVGHFRLALRYVKQAQKLFEKKNGQPPYKDLFSRREHMHLIYLLTQTRLNLDDYKGALQATEDFKDLGYYDDWYSGTRAWILMKLGRIDDAIREARLGAIQSAEQGRILNMLGILLSMRGEREQSLKVFREAIALEMSQGKTGQPATPLNNSGEVYKEIFEDDRAESSWLKAIAQRDGCEHVLPSLNLALLYIDQANFRGAKKSMDDFEGCVAQFPLRNGEEHRALVHLIRGRVDMHTGHIDTAIQHLEEALQARQWFGKIGTDEKDLEAGVMISLAQALTVKNNHMQFHRFQTFTERSAWWEQKIINIVRSWWLMRRARQLMSEDLNDLEDLNIRHTDSMIEYSTFGEMLAGLPRRTLERRIEKETKDDLRSGAMPYYKAYLAENDLAHGRDRDAFGLINEVEQYARPQFDKMLLLRMQLLALEMYEPGESDYRSLAQSVFASSKALLRNRGFALPVNTNIDPEHKNVIDDLASVGFYPQNTETLQYSVGYDFENGDHILSFNSQLNSSGGIKVRGSDLIEALNRFADEVFSEETETKR